MWLTLGTGRTRKAKDPFGQSSQLIESFKKQKSGWQKERLLALILILEGQDTQVVADTLGNNQSTLQLWVNKFRKGAIQEILTKNKGNGPQSQLTPEMEACMIEQLKLGNWRTARDAWRWLKDNYDVSDLKESVIYKYLGKCEWRLKATRPYNPLKDQAAEDKFRVSLAEKMEAFNIHKEQDVKLWVYDEMRYGHLPLTRKMWCLKGVRAIAPSRLRYQNGYLHIAESSILLKNSGI